MSHDEPSSATRDVLVARLGKAFAHAGESLYLVGGAVRDELLDIVDLDLDFATSARPERTLQILEPLQLGPVFRIGEKFGTIGLRADERLVEITTFRSAEVYAGGSRKPRVQFGRTIEEDLTRRDFTVNAMARKIPSGELIDPLGGEADLYARLLRAVGAPAERFEEDALRLLRAVRFAAKLDFVIEDATWAAVQSYAPALDLISRERIRDEYSRILVGPRPTVGLRLLRDSGLLQHSVPELLELTLMPDHGPRHPLSLWDHVMRVIDAVPPELAVRWAALLHDIAKPVTRTHEADGRPRFFRHEEVGAQVARRVLSGLRYPKALVDEVALLVETHMQLHAYSLEWSDGAVRRLLLRLGPHFKGALALARADAAGHSLDGRSENAPKFDHLEKRVRDLESEPVETLRSPLSGDDLMARYGKAGGPWIRRVKDALLESVMEGSLSTNDRHAAWQIADRLMAEDEERSLSQT